MVPRLAAHQATTRNLGAAYPFLSESGLGDRGVLVGRDLFGGAFVHDPFELYRQGVVTNPNMVVLGQVGRGKSAFVKSYLWRQSIFGRRAWVVDPKGEYGPLAAAWGVQPIALRPGGRFRLNPLDAPTGEGKGGSGDTVEVGRRRAELLASLAAASLDRRLSPRERAALELGVLDATDRSDGRPTLPLVVDSMLSPSPAAAQSVATQVGELASDGRDVALELRRLVAGDLQGMFDGPTSRGIDLGGPLVVLDLSAVYHSAALGVLMTCATAWLQSALRERSVDGGVFLVVDEAWAVLANLSVARWLQSSWKLSRAFGVANVAVVHRLSDLTAAGSFDSEQVRLAEGLLSDSETRVVYAQPAGEIERAGELLGLSETEIQLVPRLRRGVALWKIGSRSFLVHHVLGPSERDLVDTDHRMNEGRTTTGSVI
jgi:hypothetical protein